MRDDAVEYDVVPGVFIGDRPTRWPLFEQENPMAHPHSAGAVLAAILAAEQRTQKRPPTATAPERRPAKSRAPRRSALLARTAVWRGQRP